MLAAVLVVAVKLCWELRNDHADENSHICSSNGDSGIVRSAGCVGDR
jgi:hypothetical protein